MGPWPSRVVIWTERGGLSGLNRLDHDDFAGIQPRHRLDAGSVSCALQGPNHQAAGIRTRRRSQLKTVLHTTRGQDHCSKHCGEVCKQDSNPSLAPKHGALLASRKQGRNASLDAGFVSRGLQGALRLMPTGRCLRLESPRIKAVSSAPASMGIHQAAAKKFR